MRKILGLVLVMVVLASVVPLAVTPAAAYEWKIPCDDGDNELTKAELVNAILPYMLGEGALTLDNVGDAAYVYAYWDGKPKTIVDYYGKTVTAKRPAERIVIVRRHALETLRNLKVPKDQIVGVENIVQYPNYKSFFPEFQDKPIVGITWTPDTEVILSLKPDVVFLTPSPGMSGSSTVDAAADTLESVGITVLRSLCKMDASGLEIYTKDLRDVGYILDREKEAEEFGDWYDAFVDEIREKLESVPEESRPKVYYEGSFGTYRTDSVYDFVEASGGKNIFEGISGNIDPEELARLNPEIIVKVASGKVSGYDLNVGDTTGIEEIREEVMSRDMLQDVPAVENGSVYVISGYLTSSGPDSAARGFLQIMYQAKWFNSTLFENLDPKALHQEYLTEFQGLDINLNEKGVFVYPEEPI